MFCDLSFWIFLYELLTHITAKIKPKIIITDHNIVFLTRMGLSRSLFKKFDTNKCDTNNTNHHTNDTNISIIGMLFVY